MGGGLVNSLLPSLFSASLARARRPARRNAEFPWEPRTDMVAGFGLSYGFMPKVHFGFYG